MSELDTVDSPSRIAMAWLVRLRWGNAAGQILAVASGTVVFGIHIRLLPALSLAALTVVSNALLQRWLSRNGHPSQQALAAVLSLDVSILGALLFVSGGAMNPFSVFFLVHVALAALILHARATWALAAWSSVVFGSLFLVPLPEGTDPMAGHAHMMADHLRGMWIAYTLASFFVAHFVSRAARALEQREQQIQQLHAKAARAEKLASLSTLAAGAAHELGTPLGTIAVVAKELVHAASNNPEIAEDAQLIRSEVDRCRGILQQMGARAGESVGEAPITLTLIDAVNDARETLRQRASLIDIDATELSSHVVYAPRRALAQVLVILLNNALDAQAENGSSSLVRLRSRIEKTGVAIDIIDTGPGISSDRLARIGEPFFTTKAPGKGLGLGLFLALAFADRVGGHLTLTSTVGEGTTASLWIPSAPPLTVRTASFATQRATHSTQASAAS
ncbi:MAG: ATP-binding protein [Polyangiaceae bacterium]